MSDLHLFDSLFSPHTKTLTIKHLKVVEAQWSWNQGLLERRYYTVIQISLFFLSVLKAKNNPLSFLFTGQTDIHIYGKNPHTLSILIKKLSPLGKFQNLFFKSSLCFTTNNAHPWKWITKSFSFILDSKTSLLTIHTNFITVANQKLLWYNRIPLQQ